MPDEGAPSAGRPASSPDDGAGGGYRFYGVLRSGAWRGLRAEPVDDLLKVRYRDLEALVRAVDFALPPLDAEHVQDHQRIVEATMRRNTILPAPYGVVFRGRRALIRFLQDEYVALDEGLSFLEGHWELRLHLSSTQGEVTPELLDVATRVYTELRRHARAALPLPRREDRLLGAAFLVERDSWIRFIERADDLVADNTDISLDITGPWPPYDFVRIVS